MLGLNLQLLTSEFGSARGAYRGAVFCRYRAGRAARDRALPRAGLRAPPRRLSGRCDRPMGPRWSKCDTDRSPYGFQKLTGHIEAIVEAATPDARKALLRSEPSFNLWQSILRGPASSRAVAAAPTCVRSAPITRRCCKMPSMKFRRRRHRRRAPRGDARGAGRRRLCADPPLGWRAAAEAMTDPPSLALPRSRAEIAAIQSAGKRRAVAQALRTPFHRARLPKLDMDRLDDPAEWRKIPVLDKAGLRALSDRAFYDEFCLPPDEDDAIVDFWRSGGATGAPLFYPRSRRDMRTALVSFTRTFDCIGCAPASRMHLSFPLGIHPAGRLMARAAEHLGHAVNWAVREHHPVAAATRTDRAPAPGRLDGDEQLRPASGQSRRSQQHRSCRRAGAHRHLLAEPLSAAKRAKLATALGANVFDTFGMTEAGMMGAEDAARDGLRIWTDFSTSKSSTPRARAGRGGRGRLVVVTPLSNMPSRRSCAGTRATSSRWLARDGDSGPTARSAR